MSNLPAGYQSLINLFYTLMAGSYDQEIKHEESPGARKKLFELLDIQVDEKVIEVGVGTGLNIIFMPVVQQYVCVDINKRMLELARKKAFQLGRDEIEFVQTNAREKLGYADGHFDVGLMTYALSGMPAHEQALQELERLVRPGGKIGILDYKGSSPGLSGGAAGLHLPQSLEHRTASTVISSQEFVSGRVLRYERKPFPGVNTDYQMIYVLEVH